MSHYEAVLIIHLTKVTIKDFKDKYRSSHGYHNLVLTIEEIPFS